MTNKKGDRKRTVKEEVRESMGSPEGEDMLWMQWEETRRELKTTEKELDKAWNNVQHKVNKPKDLSYTRKILRIAAILAGLIMGGTALLFISQNTPDDQMVAVETPKGVRSEFLLPDGTKVWLNSNSKLSYPKSFSNTIREVKLSGEAYFDVYHNPAKPFVVKTTAASITALGTQFYVSDYAENSSLHAGLIEGVIRIQNTENELLIKEPTAVKLNKTTNTITTGSTPVDEYYAWKDGLLVLDNVTLGNLINRLENWYNITIDYSKEYKSSYGLTLKVKEESFEEISTVLEQIAPFRIQKTGERAFQLTVI